MESSLSNEIKVGIFVLVGIVAFCVVVLLLGGDKMFFRKTYVLKVNLPQVQGLASGSVVSLSGVPVGNITMLKFVNQAKEIEVTMLLDISVQPRITEGTLASVKTQGALGDKYIYLEPGPLDARAMKDGEFVKADQSPDMFDMIAQKSTEISQVFETVRELKALIHTFNTDNRTGKLMDNLVTGSANFNQLMIEGRQTMTHFSAVGKKLDEGKGTLGSLINDPAIHNRIMSIIGDSPRNKFLKPMIRDTIQSSEKVGGR
jgi:phospholipid/cholesterol/gamma-HCH transport system substrate-binding protein